MISRSAIFEKLNGHCAYCGCEIEISAFQLDHITSKKRGGKDIYANLFPACRPCNHRKNILSVEEFRLEILQQIKRLKRDSNQFNLALRYGLIKVTDKPVTFHFEES